MGVMKCARFFIPGFARVRLAFYPVLSLFFALPSWPAENVMLTGVPDYTWYAGCFGSATGNLMGYWDRHGFPNFYTGPTAGGIAPLNSNGTNQGIRSMWASRAGFDGRPADQPGHIDDYWAFYNNDSSYSFESTAPDPYILAGRPEHPPDCIGDFIGLSQKKWANLNGECDGNIDGYAFVFWESTGARRVNYVPPPQNEIPVRDIPSGLKAWTEFRGDNCDVYSQLTDFNPAVSAGHGFTFEELKAEIDAGYPVLLFQQSFDHNFRAMTGMERANPFIHSLLAYGYFIGNEGGQYVRYKTSWGSSGNNTLSQWNAENWQANLPIRGVIGYRPLPRITSILRTNDAIRIEWHGPSSTLSNLVTRTATPLHSYVVERTAALVPDGFVAVTEPSADLHATLDSGREEEAAFYRIRLVHPYSVSAAVRLEIP
jgi:hypothetical protein